MSNFLMVCVVLFLLVACGGGGGFSDSSGSGGFEDEIDSDVEDSVLDDDVVSGELQVLPVEPVGGGSQVISLFSKEVLGDKGGAVSEEVGHGVVRSVDIVVPDGFDVSREQHFVLAVNHDEEVVSFLSVCTDFEVVEGEGVDINYESCVLRRSLRGGELEVDITVANHVKSLVAALWFVDDTIEPVLVRWDFNGEGGVAL